MQEDLCGFMIDDIDVRIVNPLSQRESGLCLLTVNDPATCYRLKSKKFPKTYRIQAEFGKRSDTMFTDGKILEKSTFSHLENRPQKFHSLLNSIQNSHQKEAFKYLKVIRCFITMGLLFQNSGMQQRNTRTEPLPNKQ